MATDLIVLFALEREAKPFRRLMPQVPVAITGVGIKRARQAAILAIDAHHPRRLILAGFGGALDPTLKIGDVLVAGEVIDESGYFFRCFDSPLRLLTVNRMIATAADRLALHQRFAAAVCDMESSAVARICQEAGVAFSAVRAVSDAELPPQFDDIIQDGAISYRRLFLHCVRRPSLVWTLLELNRGTHIAANQLALALRQLTA